MISKLSAAAAIVLALTAHQASALDWTWSIDNGLTFGTFETDGDALNGAAGTYTITGFNVTGSDKFTASLVTSWAYSTGGTQGFIWDGSAPTQFWRNNGLNPNGSNFYGTPGQGDYSTVWVALGLTGQTIGDNTDFNPIHSITGAVTMQVVPPAVPVPGALPLLGSVMAAGALMAARRRKG